VSAPVEYYQAVEEYFVARRGDPLFLSNADWLLVHRWKAEGIPLRVVLRGIKDALDGHTHSWSRTRKVSRLAYCKGEVEIARDRWQRALAGAGDGPAEPALRLLVLADALAAAHDLAPEVKKLAAETAAALRSEAVGSRDSRALEARLQGRERALRQALEQKLDAERRASLREAIERELSPYKTRMPAKVLGQIREEALTRRLFEAHALPRLTLFDL
jgi:hypothetical protein